MQGLVDYQAILEMVFSSTLQKVKGKDGGVNWDDYADMYNEMTGMETASTLNLLSNLPITKDDSVLETWDVVQQGLACHLQSQQRV